MSVVNHLKNQIGEKITLPLGFGRNLVQCEAIKSKTIGTSPTHQIVVQQPLGDGYGFGWQELEAMWLKGQILPTANIAFHPGTQSTGNTDTIQGVDAEFPTDVPHSNTVVTVVKYPVGFGDADTKTNLPENTKALFKCQKMPIYNSSGTQTSVSYSENPADQVSFLLRNIRKLPSSLIDWAAMDAWRSFNNQTESFNFRTQATGCGLWTEFFNDIDLTPAQKVAERIEPVAFVPTTSGSFDFRQNPDNFSVRFEGFFAEQNSGT